MDNATSRPNVALIVESIVRDVYFGCRLLWNNVTVTVVAVVSLSLAIGACTASFFVDRRLDPAARCRCATRSS